jgi:hypothetical protein
MSEVEELEDRIRNLPSSDFVQFREWFHDFENEVWDQQIAADFRAGKFNDLIERARAEFAEGKAREL